MSFPLVCEVYCTSTWTFHIDPQPHKVYITNSSRLLQVDQLSLVWCRVCLGTKISFLRGSLCSFWYFDNGEKAQMSNSATSMQRSPAHLRLLSDLKMIRREPPEVRPRRSFSTSWMLPYQLLTHRFFRRSRGAVRVPWTRATFMCGVRQYSVLPIQRGRAGYSPYKWSSVRTIRKWRRRYGFWRQYFTRMLAKKATYVWTFSAASGDPSTLSTLFWHQYSRFYQTQTHLAL